jgi:hypothetical protein
LLAADTCDALDKLEVALNECQEIRVAGFHRKLTKSLDRASNHYNKIINGSVDGFEKSVLALMRKPPERPAPVQAAPTEMYDVRAEQSADAEIAALRAQLRLVPRAPPLLPLPCPLPRALHGLRRGSQQEERHARLSCEGGVLQQQADHMETALVQLDKKLPWQAEAEAEKGVLALRRPNEQSQRILSQVNAKMHIC